MTDEDSLWAAQRERPDDVLLMLVTADYLQERGNDFDYLRGEMLRLLGECGLIGCCEGYYPHFVTFGGVYSQLPAELVNASYTLAWELHRRRDYSSQIGHRNLICRSYAAASQELREAWTSEILLDFATRRETATNLQEVK